MIRRTLLFAILVFTALVQSVRADAVLVMVEEQGCMWCARWNAEISEIYPKTEEGQLAPLLRVDIDETPPRGITFARRLNFTPTFVLVIDGVEAGRIEGYPGEDFFWGLLQLMLTEAGITVSG
jgi:hypothetical protein